MANQQMLINGSGPNGATLQLQHYLVNNHIPKALDQPNPNVHVQIVKQEQAQQRFIIHRQYQQQVQNVQLQALQQTPQAYWVLVEVESNNELNSYAMVESKDVEGQPMLENLTTGKLIIVTINGMKRRATVVITSSKSKNFHQLSNIFLSQIFALLGDQKFIYTEYEQLRRQSEENLNLKLRDDQPRKRRRISASDNARKDIDEDSSLSGWSGVSQNVNTDRVMSPSTNVQLKAVKSDHRYVPPMMFDQGCQTDTRMTGDASGLHDKIQELQKLIELSEHMLSEQKLLKNEAMMSRLLVESFSDEFSAMRKSMQMVESKVESLLTERGQYDTITSEPTTAVKKKLLNGSNPFYIIEGNGSENASLSFNGSAVEYTVEELEAEDSGRSTSRLSYHDQTSMMSNSSTDYVAAKKELFRRSHSSSNFSVHSASSTPIAQSKGDENMIEEWKNLEGDVLIGSNKTTVAVHILRAIDWKNYRAATRKLLITLFSREMLATRSLTGKPSPAFHDRKKPVKDKLDQNIINDIIQIITKKCGVQENLVRTAITTKCADENKMLRTRKDNEEKEKFKTPTNRAAEGNKENIVEN